MKYVIVVQNPNGDNLRVFEQNEFDDVVKYMEESRMHTVSAYRIQLVAKGGYNK